MNLLDAKLYDPSTAASKSTASLLAMTAFDTANLRLTVTVPAHGLVRFRLRCTVEGATTFPQVLLGVLNGATVVGRVSPLGALPGTAVATTRMTLDAEFTATGLTPGSTNFDAAYGVEIVVASTNIKYGGPNNTTTDDAWGAFVFEAWDPRPLKLALDGGVNVTQWLGTAVTAATAGIPDVNVKNINNVAAATPGAAGGILISGSNAGTTTFGAVTCTGAFTISDGLAITRSTASGNGVDITGAAASGANAGGHGIVVTGGASNTTGGGTSGVGVKVVGGAGSVSANGASAGMTVAGGGGSAAVSGGNGITLTATGNQDALSLNGAGTGRGLFAFGGATGGGIVVSGGATSGDGISISTVSGHGIIVTATGSQKDAFRLTGGAAVGAGPAGHALNLAGGASSTTGGGTAGVGINVVGGAGSASGNGAGEGVTIVAGGTVTVAGANGISVTGTGALNGILATSGGGATGDGIKGVAASTNGNGIRGVGIGTGAGLLAAGGATGHGISGVGGATSGSGLSVVATTSGDGITATGVGTTKHGINAVGGSTTSHGIVATGGGVGHGILATSGTGATGDGIRAVAASTNGNGAAFVHAGSGADILGNISGTITTATNVTTVNGLAADVITAAATAADFGTEVAAAIWRDAVAGDFTVASSIGKALYINNVAPGGAGGHLISGANSGTTTLGALTITGATTHTGNVILSDGLTISAPSTGNRAGITITGNGTGAAISLTGGATGQGILIAGGGTSGDGIKVTTTSGHGINLAPAGTSMHGFFATGGTAGTSDGIKAVAGSGGVDIRGNITGSVTGTLSDISVTTFAEPVQGAPAASSTLATKLGYLFKAWRNKSDQTGSLYQLYSDDAVTVDQKGTVADDGTTFSRGEIASGP